MTSDTSDVAPDRLPAPGVLSFDPSAGLAMAPGASVFVSDRTYADLTLDVDSPTGEPALVVLRDGMGDELEVGGTTCAGAITSGTSSLHVERRGASVSWAITGAASGTCALGVDATARLSIGLRAPASADRSLVRNLRVTRLGSPD